MSFRQVVIAAVVLAAGAATRMGRPKQLLTLGGRPLVWHVVHAAAQSRVDEVIVVTGAASEAVTAAVAGLPVRPVRNDGWQAGQASSLRVGLKALGPEVEAAIFLLADQPLVTGEVIDALIAAYHKGGGSIAAPVCGSRRGNPVLFALGRWRAALLALEGDAGARGIVAANPAEVAAVLVAEELFFDVDSPEDYDRLLAMYGR